MDPQQRIVFDMREVSSFQFECAIYAEDCREITTVMPNFGSATGDQCCQSLSMYCKRACQEYTCTRFRAKAGSLDALQDDGDTLYRTALAETTGVCVQSRNSAVRFSLGYGSLQK